MLAPRLGEVMLDGLIWGSDLALAGTFVAVFRQLRSSGSAAGLSLQTLVAIVLARCLHLLSHPLGLHYQPVVLPSAMFHLMDLGNASAGVACLWHFGKYYYTTYEKEKDNFGIQLFDYLDCLPKTGPFRHRSVAAATFLWALIAVAALMWYPMLRGSPSFLSGYFCCFYETLCAIALLPQLWMFNKERRVPPLLASFVLMVALGRLFVLTFWWSYPYVYTWNIPSNRRVQMGSEALNLLILSDFLYYWTRAKLRGEKEVVIGDEFFV